MSWLWPLKLGTVCTSCKDVCMWWHRRLHTSWIRRLLLNRLYWNKWHNYSWIGADLLILYEHQCAARIVNYCQSRILPDTIKAGCPLFMGALLDHIWVHVNSGMCAAGLGEGNLVHTCITTRGGLQNCDKWQGMALLYVMGKHVARLIHCHI